MYRIHYRVQNPHTGQWSILSTHTEGVTLDKAVEYLQVIEEDSGLEFIKMEVAS